MGGECGVSHGVVFPYVTILPYFAAFVNNFFQQNENIFELNRKPMDLHIKTFHIPDIQSHIHHDWDSEGSKTWPRLVQTQTYTRTGICLCECEVCCFFLILIFHSLHKFSCKYRNSPTVCRMSYCASCACDSSQPRSAHWHIVPNLKLGNAPRTR